MDSEITFKLADVRPEKCARTGRDPPGPHFDRCLTGGLAFIVWQSGLRLGLMIGLSGGSIRQGPFTSKPEVGNMTSSTGRGPHSTTIR